MTDLTLSTKDVELLSKCLAFRSENQFVEFEFSKKISYVDYERIIKHLQAISVETSQVGKMNRRKPAHGVSAGTSSEARVISVSAESTFDILISKYRVSVDLSSSKGEFDDETMTSLCKFLADGAKLSQIGKFVKKDKMVVQEKIKREEYCKPLEEYPLFCKISTEQEIDPETIVVKETSYHYRSKNRITFKFKGFKIDITAVSKGRNWEQVLTSQDQHYEFEIEVTGPSANIDLEEVKKIISFAQQLLDATEIVIGKSEKQQILDLYKSKVAQGASTHKVFKFRNLITLEKHHMRFLLSNYSVSEKTDGQRFALIVWGSTVYLCDLNFRIIKTRVVVDPKLNGLFIDGEFVNGSQYYAFDIIHFDVDLAVLYDVPSSGKNKKTKKEESESEEESSSSDSSSSSSSSGNSRIPSKNKKSKSANSSSDSASSSDSDKLIKPIIQNLGKLDLKARYAHLEFIIQNYLIVSRNTVFVEFPKYLQGSAKEKKPASKGADVKAMYNYYETTASKYYDTLKGELSTRDGSINYPIITRKVIFHTTGIFGRTEIFHYIKLIDFCRDIFPYKTDGEIFTPYDQPYHVKMNSADYDTKPLEYKRKPASENSIDFYVVIDDQVYFETVDARDASNGGSDNASDSDTSEADQDKKITKKYKIINLHVGEKIGKFEKPVPFVVDGKPQIAKMYLKEKSMSQNSSASESENSSDTSSSESSTSSEEDEHNQDIFATDGSLIENNSVVEFICKFSKDGPVTMTWIPIKNRKDKTESVRRLHTRYGNYKVIANRNFRSMKNPITMKLFLLLCNEDTFDQTWKDIRDSNVNTKAYFQETNKDTAKHMRAFNNWVKTELINVYISSSDKVIDFGCGRGGDIGKMLNKNVALWVGLDIDYESLFNINENASERISNLHRNKNRFILINADVGTPFNKMKQKKILPVDDAGNLDRVSKYLSFFDAQGESLTTKEKQFDVINCQFSLNYYLQDNKTWDVFCQNVNACLRDRGYLLLTLFDGQLVSEVLTGKNNYEISYIDNNGNKIVLANIIKKYKDSSLLDPAFVPTIAFYNPIISEEENVESLVFPKYLEKELAERCSMILKDTATFHDLFIQNKESFMDADQEHNFTNSNRSESIDFVQSAEKYTNKGTGVGKGGNKNAKRPPSNKQTLIQQLYKNVFIHSRTDAAAELKFLSLYRYYVFEKIVIDPSGQLAQGGAPQQDRQDMPSDLFSPIGKNLLIPSNLVQPYFATLQLSVDNANYHSDYGKLVRAILKSQNLDENNVKVMMYFIQHPRSSGARKESTITRKLFVQTVLDLSEDEAANKENKNKATTCEESDPESEFEDLDEDDDVEEPTFLEFSLFFYKNDQTDNYHPIIHKGAGSGKKEAFVCKGSRRLNYLIDNIRSKNIYNALKKRLAIQN